MKNSLRSALGLFSVLCGFLLLPGIGRAEDRPSSQISVDMLEKVELSSVESLDLSFLIEDLQEMSVVPQTSEAFRVAGEPEMLLIPLDSPAEAASQLFLYYIPEQREFFFLRISADPLGRPEMRLWGRAAAEILISQDGAVLLPEPSEHTFRLDPAQDLSSRFQEIQSQAAPTFVDDTLACIARTLGLSINTTTLQNLLTSASCSATSSFALALTAFSCLNPTPVGILGCTVGIAKIIACSLARCSSPTPASCQGTIAVGQRVNSSWSSDCVSVHRSGSFAKYFTFTLSSGMSLQIDLESLLTDPVLFVLGGDSPSGSALAVDDDAGLGWNSRITRFFSAGTYTLEATTFSRSRTGSFTVTLTRR